MTDTVTVERTIAGVVVPVSAPYAVGHTITEAEAKALNQTYAENISNNMRKQVKEMTEEGKSLEEIAAAVAEYDASYEFTLASVSGGGAKLDPLTKECMSLARAAVHAKIKEAGHTLKAYKEANQDKYEELIHNVSQNEKIVKAAKANLKQREQLADIEL